MSHSKKLHGGVLGSLLIWHFQETFPYFPLDFWTRPIKNHSDSDFEVHIPGRAGEPVLIGHFPILRKNMLRTLVDFTIFSKFEFSLSSFQLNLRMSHQLNESFYEMTNENLKFLFEFSQSEDSISHVRKLKIKKRD